MNNLCVCKCFLHLSLGYIFFNPSHFYLLPILSLNNLKFWKFWNDLEISNLFFLFSPILIFYSIMLSLLVLLALSYYFHCAGFVGFLFIMEQFIENKNLKMNVGIEIFENEMLMEDELVIETSMENLSLQTQVRSVNQTNDERMK